MELSDPLEQLVNLENLNKYKMAGLICTKVLDKLINTIQPYSDIFELCCLGDKLIIDACQEVYLDIKEKGIAFPCCISVNNIAGCFSPTKEKSIKIKKGDVVKIELGVHIDGFPAVIAYTIIVNWSIDDQDSRKLNLIKSLTEASKEILNVLKPGKTNNDVQNIMDKFSKKYDLNTMSTFDDLDEIKIPGIISYQISKFILDGNNDDTDNFVHKCILCKNCTHYPFFQRETEFEENEIYAVDLMYSTGSGKLHKSDYETNIYKRSFENWATLKLNSSKKVITSFNSVFPININKFMTNSFKLGLKECNSKKLLCPYDIYEETQNELIGRLKFTVIIGTEPILIAARSEDQVLNSFKTSLLKN
ncbi:Peptidase family M24 [uncultured virus]|nr:Peptidase family M24 [uncultured virus]